MPPWVWWGLIGLLAGWVAARLGAFDLWGSVVTDAGERVRFPATFATVDHPFHAMRAEMLRRALADGELLRWIGNHQGGYPVEFYPLGVAWLEVGLWGAALGALPMMAIHKLTVIAIFLLPGPAFALMARRDGLPLGVGLAALAGHVGVAGWWWSGGYRELVQWGLVTNVTASVALLFTLLWLASYLSGGAGWEGALASGAAAFAIWANPRSLMALAIIGLGCLTAAVWAGSPRTGGRPGQTRYGGPAGRLALVAVVAAALAAPELSALVRFEDLYFFVRYSGYGGLAEYWDSAVQAVSGPILLLGALGAVSALRVGGGPATRAAAVTLVVYVLMTAILVESGPTAGWVEQLETTRLMPFQRLLTIYLAAVAVARLGRWLGRRIGWRPTAVAEGGLALAAAGLLILYVIAPPGFVPEGDRGLFAVETTDVPSTVDLRAAVRAADAVAAPGTALLVLGTRGGWTWHDRLWAPQWSDRPFFYDDWLWYWQTRHYGDYDPLREHAYRSDASALEPEYLARHGIGAVIVTGEAKGEAALADELRPVRSGIYDVYAVREPTSIVTVDGVNAARVEVGNGRVSGVATQAGTARVRRNWFPRWRATVDGEPAPIRQTDDGYMEVEVGKPGARIEVRYVADGWDWAARGAMALGVMGLVGLAVGGEAARRRGKPSPPAATSPRGHPGTRPASQERGG